MIGIIGAMGEEIEGLREHLFIEETVMLASMQFLKGTIGQKEVVLVRSGIGKVNAAVCAQILVANFGVDTLINTGVAGSLDAQIDIGDIVISSDAVYHDMDTSVLGDPVGQVPRMDTFSFPSDKRLVTLAKESNEEVNPDISTYIGRIASGDQFIASDKAKRNIVQRFHASCAEMEGAAIAHVAYLNKISCVIIRAISDKADNSAVMNYAEFEHRAINHYVRLVLSMIAKM